jgi:hypothetical protein
MFRSCLLLLTGLSTAAILQDAQAQSFYPVRLEDKAAVYLRTIVSAQQAMASPTTRQH